MIVYVYQKGEERVIDMVSTDGMKVYEKAWEDFCTEVGKEEGLLDFNDKESAFTAFMDDGGGDYWVVTRWEI